MKINDVGVSVNEADTSINYFENKSDFETVDYVGNQVKFCAHDDEYESIMRLQLMKTNIMLSFKK